MTMTVSFVIAKKADGEIEILAVSESSDPALDCFHRLKKTKGRDENGRQLYTDAALFIRPKTNRRTHFA
jgi:hypothetical protein